MHWVILLLPSLLSLQTYKKYVFCFMPGAQRSLRNNLADRRDSWHLLSWLLRDAVCCLLWPQSKEAGLVALINSSSLKTAFFQGNCCGGKRQGRKESKLCFMTREYKVDCKLKAFFEAKVRCIQRKEISIAKGSRSRNKYSLWRTLKWVLRMNRSVEGERESLSLLCLFFCCCFFGQCVTKKNNITDVFRLWQNSLINWWRCNTGLFPFLLCWETEKPRELLVSKENFRFAFFSLLQSGVYLVVVCDRLSENEYFKY